MSNPYRVVDIHRIEFEPFPDFVTPQAITAAEIRRREREGKGVPALRSQYAGLLRMAKILEIMPSTDHKALRFITSHFASACIGAAGYDLFIDETMGQTPEPHEARTRKPVRLPRYDTDNPEERPTAIQLADEAIVMLYGAAGAVKKLPRLRRANPELARSATIQHGRVIGAIGFRLACWNIADELAYEGESLSKHAVQHIVREQVIAQKTAAFALADTTEMTPSINQLAHPYSPLDVYMHKSGIETVRNVLDATEQFTIPT